MNYALFTNLFKYKEKAGQSPLENYLTELFAYILDELIQNKNPVAITLLNDYFHIPFSEKDFWDTKVETQCSYYVCDYDCTARPDIKITLRGKDVYFIENKVEAEIAWHGSFDQIELYEKIQCENGEINKGIRILSKYAISTHSKNFSSENIVFWRQIYGLFKKTEFDSEENLIIQNFLNFLEENNMAVRKSLELSEGGLKNFYVLYNFLSENLTDFAGEHGYKAVVFDGNSDYFGFNIMYDKKPYIWVGCYDESPDEIVVESYAENTEKLTKKLGKVLNPGIFLTSKYGNRIFAKILISEIQKEKTAEGQAKIFSDWLKENHVGEILAESYNLING